MAPNETTGLVMTYTHARTILLALLGASAVVGCHRHGRAWDRAPLGPVLRLGEAVAPGDVLVLLVDAHSGALVGGASSGGTATLTPPAPAPSRWMERVDSAGRIRFHGVPPGSYELRVRAFGYEDWRMAVAVSDRIGWVALAQLRRRPVHLVPIIVGTERPDSLSPGERR